MKLLLLRSGVKIDFECCLRCVLLCDGVGWMFVCFVDLRVYFSGLVCCVLENVECGGMFCGVLLFWLCELWCSLVVECVW